MDAFGIGYLVIGAVFGLVCAVLVARNDDWPSGTFDIGIVAVTVTFIWPAAALVGVIWTLGAAIEKAATR